MMAIHSKCSFIVCSRLCLGVLSYSLKARRRKIKQLSLLFIELKEQIKSKGGEIGPHATGALASSEVALSEDFPPAGAKLHSCRVAASVSAIC